MKIELVELENVRSHVKSSVPFAKGFNCLVGGVGTGKSSVLYAVDFALFGEPIGRSYDYLLRDGADVGKIILRFIHDGRAYTIVRALRRRGKGISQDVEQLKLFEGDRLIASANNEAVLEQLKAFTGLDRDIFHNVIWVRQERLKELLDVGPRERQKRLDELLGLSDYEVAWSNIANISREYEGELKVYERDYDVLSMEKFQAEYNQCVEEFIKVEGELQELRRKAVEVEASLERAESALRSLEELRKRVEELKKKEGELQASIASIEDACTRLINQVKEKTMRIRELEQGLRALNEKEVECRNQLQRVGLKLDQTIDDLNQMLIVLNDQVVNMRAELELTKKNIQMIQQRLSNVVAWSSCPLCLQSLTDEYKHSLIQRLNEEGLESKRKLEELQKNVNKLGELRDIISNVVSNLQVISLQRENSKVQFERENDSLNKIHVELEEKKQLGRRLRDQLGKVQAEISKFDLSKLELTRKIRDECLKDYSRLKARLELVEARKADLSLKMDELKERLDKAQKKVDRMKAVEIILEVIDVIRNAYRGVQPKLRNELILMLEFIVQQMLDTLVEVEGSTLAVRIDETYTPFIVEGGRERDISNLSGGERTLLAFAYRLGLGQLVMRSKVGHELELLLLDEPTESLGREDGSIDRLADALSRLKAIEQIIAVTHSEAFAERAEHVIRFEKKAGISRISLSPLQEAVSLAL